VISTTPVQRGPVTGSPAGSLRHAGASGRSDAADQPVTGPRWTGVVLITLGVGLLAVQA